MRYVIVAVAVGTLAATVFTIGTAPPGPGLDPDAESYLGAAVSLAGSGSYRIPMARWTVADTTQPLTHFPPGFPTLLAAPIAIGVSPLESARVIIALAAFATWAGIVLLLTRAASLRTAVVTAVALLCTPAVVLVHLSVLSEPPFFPAFVAVLAGMWWMGRSPTSQAAMWTGLAAAGGVMIRYAGVSLAIAAGWWAVMGAGRRHLLFRDRVRDAAVVVLPSGIALAAWILRSVRLEGVQGVRRIGAYGALSSTLRGALETLVVWVVPVGGGAWRNVLAAIALSAAAGLTLRAWPRARARFDLLSVISTVGVAYVGFVLVSRLVADPNIVFDERILAPLLVLAELAVGLLIAAWWPQRSRSAGFAVAGLIGLWLAASAGVSVSRIVLAREDGNDFAGSDWRDSPTVAWVRSSAGGARRMLYTNWPAAVYFQAGRAAHDLPESLDALTLHRFRERLARTHGVVVAFLVPSPDVAPPDSIAHLLGLSLVARLEDGTIWEEARDSSRSSSRAR